jgi:PAS domain S-box-containing protein
LRRSRRERPRADHPARIVSPADLELQGPESSGWLEFRDGRLVGCPAGQSGSGGGRDPSSCAGAGAAFTSRRPLSPEEPVDGTLGPALRSVEELLLEAAWIEDELAARRRFLPADDEPLAADPDRRLESPADLPSLPVNAVLATVRQRNGVCLADLLSSELAAPGRTRLAVAVLVEVGGLRRQSGEQEAPRAANQPAAERRGGRIAEAIGTASWSGADDFRVVDEEVAFPEGRLIVSRSDPAGKITYVNDAFCEISGYDRAEVLGKPHSILRHPDMPNALFRGLWETLGRREIWHGYVKNRCKDGRYYWVYATIIPNQRGGRVVGYTSVRREPSRARVEEIEAEYRASSSRRVEADPR